MNCVKNEKTSSGQITWTKVPEILPVTATGLIQLNRFTEWENLVSESCNWTITCFYSAKKRRMNQRSIRSNNLANSLMRFTLFADLNLDGRDYERLLKKSILWTLGVNCVQGQRVANKTFQKSRKTDTSCCMIYLSQLAVAVDAKLPALPYFGSWRYFTYTRRVTVLSYIWRVIANLNGQI